MAIAYDWVAGDTASKLIVTCTNKEDQTAIDLTNSTVKLKWKIDSGSLVSQTMDIVDAAAGTAEYTFGVDAEGLPELTAVTSGSEFVGEVEITDGTSKVITTPTQITKSIRYKPA